MPVDPAHAPEPAHHVPADNEPGHHPPVEQDKPSVARVRQKKQKEAHRPERHTFDLPFDPLYRWVGLPFDVRPGTTQVEVTEDDVVIRFGPWSTRIERSTIVDAEVTGPYSFAKTAGPPHLSLADRGVTFATNNRRGVCLHLSRPVAGIEPLGVIKHPGVTVTVDDPQGLVDLLQPR